MSFIVPKSKTYIPNSGDTIVFEQFDYHMVVIIVPTTDLASLTIQWPTPTINGQMLTIVCGKNIASVSHTNGTLNRSMSTFLASGNATFVWDATNSVWMSNGMTVSTTVEVPFDGKLIAGGAGNVVFYATDTGLVGGNAIFSSISKVIPTFDVADPLKAVSKPVVSNGNKTITTNCKISQQNLVTILGISVIGSTTLANAPDGTSLSFMVFGTLA